MNGRVRSGDKRRVCPFVSRGIKSIDYKDVEMLQHFTTEYGKILPSRMTDVSAKNQRKLNKAIKRARFVALMPFVIGN